MNIPNGLQGYFSEENFKDYPKISLPQQFVDARGSITNIADGSIGDVAVITCREGAVRANHYHDNDWHLTFMISGSMRYLLKNNLNSKDYQSLVCGPEDLIYTPPNTPHKMLFLEDSIFVAVSSLSRSQMNYEFDTHRLSLNFFDDNK